MPRSILIVLAALVIITGLKPAQSGPGGGAAEERRAFLPQLVCPSCTAVEGPPTATPPSTTTPGAFEARMVELVNGARLAAGCPAALSNPILMRAAGDWSAYMARTGDYGHGTPEQFGQKYGAYPGGVMENINGGTNVPEYAFEGWMASPPHRRNLEWCYPATDPSYNPAMIYEIGVGYADGYWTLVIGDRAP